jgi:hypothetical protein
MNKVLVIAALILSSCTAEEVEPVAKDCGCNKVVDRSVITSQGRVWGFYTTINECTGLQRNDIPYSTFIPKIGECK